MKKLIATMAALVASLAFASGQATVWSLDSCFIHASRNNSSVLLAATEARKSRLQLLQSKAELLPALYLYVNQYYNWGRSVDMQELVIVRNRLTRQTSASVGASFSLVDGFASINTIAANRALAAAAASDAAQTLLDVKAEIAKAYLAAILARLSAERLSGSHDAILHQAEKVRALVDCGQRNAGDLLELEAKAADVLSQIAEAATEEAIQMEQLRRLTGYSGAFSIDPSYAHTALSDCHLPYGDVSPQTPAVVSAQHSAEAAAHALKAARGAMFPTLSLSAAYGTYYSDAAGAPFRDQVNGNRNPSVSLNLSVPIFDRGQAAINVAKARADLEARQMHLRQERENAAFQLEQMRQQCLILAEQEKALIARKELCEEKMRLADKGYEVGSISTAQWIETGEDCAQSECELLQCRCKYHFQLIILNLYYDGCQK